ncbi:adenylate/guanylate cyclase domain-containing protein, partial [bacterium]|nr:adenylate/guanylate cyclase domain-containing protein [bacterium]
MRSSFAAILVTGFFVSLCIIGLRNTGYLEFLELAAYDRYIALQSKAHPHDPRIVIIAISEADIKEMGRWPITDSALAYSLKILNKYGPRAIGLDIYRDMPVPPGEKGLSDIFEQADNIVTVKKIGDETFPGIPSPYFLKTGELTGFNDILMDTGGIVRRGLLFLEDGGDNHYSFSLLLALLYLEKDGIVPEPGGTNPKHLRLGRTTFVPFETNDGGYAGADARGYQFLLDFKGGQSAFKTFSMMELLSEKIRPEDIHDRIVMIGVTAESVRDFFCTPLNTVTDSAEDSSKMPGVVLHAQIVSQLLRSATEGDRPIRVLDDRYEWLLIMVFGILSGILALFRHSVLRFSLLVLAGLILLGIGSLLLFNAGWWVPVVPVAISWLTASAILNAFLSHQENVQKRLLMQLFSRHVSKDVAEVIWRQRDRFMEDGRPRPLRLTATVLFGDLKGFTSVSEMLDPQILMDWLNGYMKAMSHLVMEHSGVVNKFIGDAIMAVFGIPLPRKSPEEISLDARNAVDCAIAMSSEIRGLNILWEKQNLPSMKMRIGIFTGPLIAGSLGSKMRMEYTVIGDTVNIASRLEGLYKDQEDADLEKNGCRIFIGEETRLHLDPSFQTRLEGSVTLKGKGKEITIYRVTGKN